MAKTETQPDLDLFERQAKRFSLIPLGGKAPLEKSWTQWCQKKKVFNREEFINRNAGVCCGPSSGVIVLDVDDPVAFEALLMGNGLNVPETLTIMTGSDKPHYYFMYPDGGVVIRNKSFKHPIYPRHTIYDIRGVGGQVVAAGSVHPDTGKLYRVEKLVPIASPPEWLLRLNNDEAMDTGAFLEIPLPEPKDREFIASLKVSREAKDLILEGVAIGGRSEAGMTVINALLGVGYDENTVFFIFNHYAIGEKYRGKGAGKAEWLRREIMSSTAWLARQQPTRRQAVIDQPAQETVEDAIRELNEKHAVVMIGGNCLVMNEVTDPIFNRPDVDFSKYSDFRNRYANRIVPNPKRGNPPEVSIAKVWLESPNRREYKGIVFNPARLERDVEGYYNLFKGFAIEPKQGDWSLFQNHIREVISSGDENVFRYIMAWMAKLVQQPGGERPGTAIVLRGKQGTGKGCFVSQFGAIFGCHFLHITNQNQLTGRFNNHLKNALLVFCDEGIWAGDKSAEAPLKAMITEEQIMVEPKGKDIFPVKNHIRLIVASNNNWVVPAGLEERRFFVLDISDKYMQNREYFGKTFSQMDSGGREAMLHDLLHYDISGIDLRTFPRTEALMDQIVNSMNPLEKFWHDKLTEGTLSKDDDEWKGHVPTEDLYNEYIDLAGKIGGRYQLTPTQFGKEIKKLCPKVAKQKMKSDYDNGRKNHYVFPSLEECRKAFESLVKIQVQWS